jgi:hypothetical protein
VKIVYELRLDFWETSKTRDLTELADTPCARFDAARRRTTNSNRTFGRTNLFDKSRRNLHKIRLRIYGIRLYSACLVRSVECDLPPLPVPELFEFKV